jgi:hypothetical protein
MTIRESRRRNNGAARQQAKASADRAINIKMADRKIEDIPRAIFIFPSSIILPAIFQFLSLSSIIREPLLFIRIGCVGRGSIP